MSATAKKHGRLGPYSAVLRRGAIGEWVDGRSTIGRYARDLEAQLVKHCGGAPTVTQRLLIERLIHTTIHIDSLDRKLLGGEWADHDSRTHNGLVNRQRLLLREIGLGAAPEPKRSLADVVAEVVAGREGNAA